MKRPALFAAVAAIIALAACAARAEHVTIGAIKTTGAGPLYLAIEKGYFAAEGIDPEMVFFEAAQPVAVAVVSGNVDFGVTGITAGFYNLAGQGALKIIGAQGHEAPGFHNLAYLISNRAAQSGLKTLKDMGGRNVAVTQTGTPGHYVIGMMAEKYGVPLANIRVLPLQSIPNMISALTGGQADAGVTVVTVPMMPVIDRGDLRVLAWVGEELSFQDRAIFVATKTADTRRDLIERFFRAFRKGAQDYHDAFIGPDERPHDGPNAAATIAIIAKYVGQPPEAVKLGIAYVDPSFRVNVADVLRQIAWYKTQGMVKPEVDGATILDKRYVVPLPP
ncbi:MAG TPA: ABC transporter substrate-binding protein [Stellaceae bacterium]|nr:ABC transporter substrate-binding protein [Stellaceae bacterium]